jgi:hypothetical protein
MMIENEWLKEKYDSPEAERKHIFKLFRDNDESHLWPVNGNFNATERAIRQLKKFEKDGGYYLNGLELILFLDDRLSQIVNGLC